MLALTLALCMADGCCGNDGNHHEVRQRPFRSQHVAANCDVALARDPGDGGRMYANWHWCDVVSGRNRGWVYTRYLSVPFEGSAVTILHGGPNLGLPAVDFSLGPYWDEHYQSQIWFAQKASWQARWDRRRAPPKWREPASSARL